MALYGWLITIGLAVCVTLFATRRSIQGNSHQKRTNHTYVQPENDKCPICLEEMRSSDTAYLNCFHALHERCLKRLREYSKVCPTCRESI